MRGGHKISSSLEEDIYWSQFRVVQFLQRVSPNSDNGFVLPRSFVKNVREKLGGNVILKTPSGAQWVMDLAADVEGDSIWLLKGSWKEFAEAHKLQKDDTLIFKYHGNSEFVVTMFDGKTGCEKVSSYFVRKDISSTRFCTRSDVKNNMNVDIKTEKKKNIATNDSSNDDWIGRKRKGSSLSEEERKVPMRKRGWVSGQAARKQLGVKLSEGGRDVSRNKIKQEDNQEIHERDMPKRRVPTELEKNRTLERASEELNEEGLLVVMRSSYVYPRRHLVFSVKWARSHGLKNTQEVELRMDGKSWPVRFLYREDFGSMTKGWRAFVVDNGLEEDDVCLFDLVAGSNSPIIIRVRIFRVVD